MSNNKITIPQSLRVTEARGDQGGDIASRDLVLLLNQIVRKLNAADALDSGTATAATIVQALQK